MPAGTSPPQTSPSPTPPMPTSPAATNSPTTLCANQSPPYWPPKGCAPQVAAATSPSKTLPPHSSDEPFAPSRRSAASVERATPSSAPTPTPADRTWPTSTTRSPSHAKPSTPPPRSSIKTSSHPGNDLARVIWVGMYGDQYVFLTGPTPQRPAPRGSAAGSRSVTEFGSAASITSCWV